MIFYEFKITWHLLWDAILDREHRTYIAAKLFINNICKYGNNMNNLPLQRKEKCKL